MRKSVLIFVALFCLFFAMTDYTVAGETQFSGLKVKIDIPEGWQTQEINQVVLTNPSVGIVIVQRQSLMGLSLKLHAENFVSVFSGSNLTENPDGSFSFNGTINGIANGTLILLPDKNNEDSFLFVMVMGSHKSLTDIVSTIKTVK